VPQGVRVRLPPLAVGSAVSGQTAGGGFPRPDQRAPEAPSARRMVRRDPQDGWLPRRPRRSRHPTHRPCRPGTCGAPATPTAPRTGFHPRVGASSREPVERARRPAWQAPVMVRGTPPPAPPAVPEPVPASVQAVVPSGSQGLVPGGPVPAASEGDPPAREAVAGSGATVSSRSSRLHRHQPDLRRAGSSIPRSVPGLQTAAGRREPRLARQRPAGSAGRASVATGYRKSRTGAAEPGSRAHRHHRGSRRDVRASHHARADSRPFRTPCSSRRRRAGSPDQRSAAGVRSEGLLLPARPGKPGRRA